MKKISILGSTGSIGCNALKIVARFPEAFSVTALAAGSNTDLLLEQVKTFKPEIAVLRDEENARMLREKLPSEERKKTEVLYGDQGYQAAATAPSADMVLSAIVGGAGLLPTLAAIDAKKDIALANKETLVMAGEIVMAAVREQGIRLLPVDSEHSAIFQCLKGHDEKEVARIHLTASGGPFRTFPKSQMEGIGVEAALNHPTWKMGKKITIDSATLMNKGLEVIEAKHLFNISHKTIEVLIHPQSIIHSMVAYHDGSVIAQLGEPDMKGAIAYALSYPLRLPLREEALNFTQIGALTFEAPDDEKFPCLRLAYEACAEGRTYPAVLNGANEAAVNAFLDKRIGFMNIPQCIEKILAAHQAKTNPGLDDILEADKWARREAEAYILTLGSGQK